MALSRISCFCLASSVSTAVLCLVTRYVRNDTCSWTRRQKKHQFGYVPSACVSTRASAGRVATAVWCFVARYGTNDTCARPRRQHCQQCQQGHRFAGMRPPWRKTGVSPRHTVVCPRTSGGRVSGVRESRGHEVRSRGGHEVVTRHGRKGTLRSGSRRPAWSMSRMRTCCSITSTSSCGGNIYVL